MKVESFDSQVGDSGLPTRQHSVVWAVILLLALGASVRTLQYLVRSSLWGDELLIVANVCSKGPLDLVTHPLASYQMAPSGFLLCLKGLVAIAGASELSLRFIPFLSSLLAMFLFVRFSREWLSHSAMLLALGTFALSAPLIRHAAQVKPYSSDVAICLLCLLAARSWLAAESPRSAVRLAAVGAIAIWFSYPALFVLASIGLVALMRCRVHWSSKLGKQTGAVLAIWLASVGALTFLELHRSSKATRSYLRAFWADWMMPYSMNPHAISSYMVGIFRECFSYFLHLPKWPVFFVLLFIGSAYLLRRTQVAWLVILPFLAAVAASMLRLYPFSGRLILFLVPNIYLLMAAGIEAVIGFALSFGALERWRRSLFSGAIAGAAIIFCVWPLRYARPPFHDSETKPMISYLGEHRRDGDAVYVHNMAWEQYLFYGPQFGLRKDEATETSSLMIMGPKPLVILNDLDHFRGRSRLWILFGGGLPVEKSCAIRYLDAIGSRLDHQTAFNADLYLYDLSDRGRVMPASADEFFDRSRSSVPCTSNQLHIVGTQQ